MSDALLDALRDRAREYVRRYNAPGAPGFQSIADADFRNDTVGTYTANSGRIVLHAQDMKALRAVLASPASATRSGPEESALRTLLHEALHSASHPETKYEGIHRAVEEATTEVMAARDQWRFARWLGINGVKPLRFAREVFKGGLIVHGTAYPDEVRSFVHLAAWANGLDASASPAQFEDAAYEWAERLKRLPSSKRIKTIALAIAQRDPRWSQLSKEQQRAVLSSVERLAHSTMMARSSERRKHHELVRLVDVDSTIDSALATSGRRDLIRPVQRGPRGGLYIVTPKGNRFYVTSHGGGVSVRRAD